MIDEPHMLIIGSSGRNSGKTELACAVIRKFRARHPVAAVKVTTIRDGEGGCPRDGEGCGVCSSLEGNYAITEETERGDAKDTQRLLAAGAERVYWLRARKQHLEEGTRALLELLGPDRLTVCESNTLRTVLEPALFVMVRRAGSAALKQSARAVRQHVDRLVFSDGGAFDLEPEELSIVDGVWALRMRAAAVIMAGGKSGRMGQDKGFLEFKGKPLIEHVYDQLRPHFDRVLISANDPEKYAFLGAEVVPDLIPGLGPLMGIASALEASEHDRNLFVACDIPDIRIRAVRLLMREVEGYDAAVPVTTGNRAEPLFAVYRKRTLEAIRPALDSGKRRIIDAFRSCRVRYVDFGEAPWLKNLNTQEDHAAFVAERRG